MPPNASPCTNRRRAGLTSSPDDAPRNVFIESLQHGRRRPTLDVMIAPHLRQSLIARTNPHVTERDLPGRWPQRRRPSHRDSDRIQATRRRVSGNAEAKIHDTRRQSGTTKSRHTPATMTTDARMAYIPTTRLQLRRRVIGVMAVRVLALNGCNRQDFRGSRCGAEGHAHRHGAHRIDDQRKPRDQRKHQ